MNLVLKNRIAQFSSSLETGSFGTVVCPVVRVKAHAGLRTPIEEWWKFKRWTTPRGVVRPDAYTLDMKVYEAYHAIRSFLLSYTTTAVLRREQSHRIILSYLENVWKEASQEGSLQNGQVGEEWKMWIELDLTQPAGDRLAAVYSLGAKS